jgi:hypothetical protein
MDYNSFKSSWVYVAYSNDNFLNIISFYVSVPVLSHNKYYILPKDSGTFEFLVMVPSIYISLFILYEYTNLANSILTLIDMGIILLSKIKYLTTATTELDVHNLVGLQIVTIIDRKNIIINKYTAN